MTDTLQSAPSQGASTLDPPAPSFGRFFLPGPTEVRPDVLEAQVRPMIGHRGKTTQDLMARLQPALRSLFRTERPVIVCTSSATGLMEAAVRNGVRRKALSLVGGAFGKRFADIVSACGFEVERMELPWGTPHDPTEVGRRLDEGDFDAVTVVHSETSTGVLQPLEAIAAEVTRREDVVLLVDAVTSMGGAPVLTDEWGLDFVLTGSQKALALPPGLSFGVASERMMERSANAQGKGLYFDLAMFMKNLGKNETPNTPAVSLLYALEYQMDRMQEEGVEARWERHRAMSDRCCTWAESMQARTGLEMSVLAPEGYRSPTVTCVQLPSDILGSELAGSLKERGWTIAPGYGKLRDLSFRVGHMGDHTLDELNQLLEVVEEVLAS